MTDDTQAARLAELREAVGHYITALMVDGGADVAACERAMDEAFDAVSREAEWVGELNKALNEQNERLVREAEQLRGALRVTRSHILAHHGRYDWNLAALASIDDALAADRQAQP